MPIMHDEWNSYRERVVPADAPPVQIQESKRAFYAGAWALFQVLMKILEPGEEATAQDERVMEAIDRELREFNASVLAGRN